MGFLHYYRNVLRVALTHSVDIAQSVIFVALILLGIITYLFPEISAIFNLTDLARVMTAWQLAAVILGGIVLTRLIMASYWIHKDVHRKLNFDAKELGEKLGDLSREILGFCSDREREYSDRAREASHIYSGNDQMKYSWNEVMKRDEDRSRFNNETASLFDERFGSNILHNMLLLSELGVKTPFCVKAAMGQRPVGVGKWLGAIGRLLRDGKLDEAIKTGSDDKFWFHLVH
jgi:hypothetical protein